MKLRFVFVGLLSGILLTTGWGEDGKETATQTGEAEVVVESVKPAEATEPANGIETAEKPEAEVEIPAEALKEAENYFKEQSYSRAAEIFLELLEEQPAGENKKWLNYRYLDAQWRALLPGGRDAEFRQIIEALQQMGNEGKDEIGAKVAVSLGDATMYSGNEHGALVYYLQALKYWGGSTDIDLAKKEYLGIVKGFVEHMGVWQVNPPRPLYQRQNRLRVLPVEVLERAAKLSGENEAAYWSFLLGHSLAERGGSFRDRVRVITYFDEALKGSKKQDWRGESLFYFAQYLYQIGQPEASPDGSWKLVPDSHRALKLCDAYLAEYNAETDPYFHRVTQLRETILEPELTFMDQEKVYERGEAVDIRWRYRGMDKVELRISRVDTEDFGLVAENFQHNWKSWLKEKSGELVLKKTIESETQQLGEAKEAVERFANGFDHGMYLVELRGKDLVARSLFLVSRAALIYVPSAEEAPLVYLADMESGEPIAGAQIRGILMTRKDNTPRTQREWLVRTDKEGVARLEQEGLDSYGHLMLVAESNAGPALVTNGSWDTSNQGSRALLYALTDRTAYRPGQTVYYKMILRERAGGKLNMPSGEGYHVKVYDGRGAELHSGEVTWNEFGSATGEFVLTDEVALGACRIELSQKGRHVDSQELFRIEEYKLPDFRVAIEADDEDGVFVAGDTLRIQVDAEYYAGGEVSSGEMEILVRKRADYWRPEIRSRWAWFDPAQSVSRQYHRGGGGAEVFRHKQLLDGAGELHFDVPTSSNDQGVQTYEVEVRLRDAANREVVETKSFRVGDQEFYAIVQPTHRLVGPEGATDVEVKAEDVNSKGREVAGNFIVFRRTWQEVWVDPKGKKYEGNALRRAREEYGARLADLGWRSIYVGYKDEKIKEAKVKTDREGNGVYRFSEKETGCYLVRWVAEDSVGMPVVAESLVYVVDKGTEDLEYMNGDLEIVVDRETVSRDKKLSVLLNRNRSGGHVLFLVRGENYLRYEILEMPGRAKLVEVDLAGLQLPEVWLEAWEITGRKMHQAKQRILVPPEEAFLDVKVAAKNGKVRPGAENEIEVGVLDFEGSPVLADVAVIVSDAAVLAIQPRLVEDIRKFFYQRESWHPSGVRTNLMEFPVYRKPEESGVAVEGAGQIRRFTQGWGRGVGRAAGHGTRSRFLGGDDRSNMETAVAVSKSMPAPAMMPMSVTDGDMLMREDSSLRSLEQKAAQFDGVAVRTDFRELALWEPMARTDEEGKLRLSVKMPESTTEWAVEAVAHTKESRVGNERTTFKTSLPVSLRAVMPRFLVLGDQVELGGLLINESGQAQDLKVALKVEGMKFVKKDEGVKTIKLNAGEQRRVVWTVEATELGDAKVEVKVVGAAETEVGDGLERMLPVLERGVQQLAVAGGRTKDGVLEMVVEIPEEVKKDSVGMSVLVTPDEALSMLEALPYLIAYPYGCTEQTLSRFVPVIAVNETLQQLGLSAESVAKKVQELQFKAGRKTNELQEISEMEKAGVKRLKELQLENGSWPWMPKGEPDRWMTAYAVWTLAQLKDNADAKQMVERAVPFLRQVVLDHTNGTSLQTWILHALAEANTGKPTDVERKVADYLWQGRAQLASMDQALLLIILHRYEMKDRVSVLLRNIENGMQVDEDSGKSEATGSEGGVGGKLVYWGQRANWYHWWDSGVEVTAHMVRALILTDPENENILPAVRWLVRNRTGSHWTDTRKSAIAIFAISDYLKNRGLHTEMAGTYELAVDGKMVQTITFASLLEGVQQIEVPAEALKPGKQTVRVTRKAGEQELDVRVESTYFNLGEVKPMGSEIFVRREYALIRPVPTLFEGMKEERVPWTEKLKMVPGDRLEVTLTVEAKNDYHYILLEDPKPAGMESVQLLSGERIPLENAQIFQPVQRVWPMLTAYPEMRDQKVVFFLDRLPQGIHRIQYVLRAENPGEFRGLPLVGEAMYIPHVRTNSTSVDMKIQTDSKVR